MDKKNENLTPDQKLEKAIMQLGNSSVSAYQFFELADRQIVDDPKETCRSGIFSRSERITVIFGKDWLNRILVEDLTQILWVEATRIALQHVTVRRQPNTVAQGFSSDSIVIPSFTIEGEMLAAYTFLPAVNAQYTEFYENAKKTYKHDTTLDWPKRDEENYEFNYLWIDKAMPKSGESEGEGEGKGDGSGEGEGEGEGSGDGENKSGNGTSDKVKASKKAIEDYINNKKKAENWDESELNKDVIKGKYEELNGNGQLFKDYGSGNSDLMQQIIAANKSPVDPLKVLRNFTKTVVKADYESTRMRVNRRYGLVFPGHRFTYKSHILICGDASGSMEDGVSIPDCIKVIQDLSSLADIDYCWWDCNCTAPTSIKHRLPKSTAVDVCGGGGTDPSCIFDMIEKNHLAREYNGIIVFSDMCFDNSIPAPKGFNYNKILWISTKNGEKCGLPWAKHQMQCSDFAKDKK